jgi:hypothetical protein
MVLQRLFCNKIDNVLLKHIECTTKSSTGAIVRMMVAFISCEDIAYVLQEKGVETIKENGKRWENPTGRSIFSNSNKYTGTCSVCQKRKADGTLMLMMTWIRMTGISTHRT